MRLCTPADLKWGTSKRNLGGGDTSGPQHVGEIDVLPTHINMERKKAVSLLYEQITCM